MNTLVVLIVLFCLGGIIALNAKSPADKKTREQFLQELTDYLEGTMEPIESNIGTNSFRIKFRYKGQDFIYENMEKKAFKDKDYKAYLKTRTPNKLTLTFTEKKRSTKIRSDIFIASEVTADYVSDRVEVNVPKYLKDLNVFTNDPPLTNELFEDNKIFAIFKKYKNVDSRGYAFVSLGIVQGEVILEFRSTRTCYPNIYDLRGDVPSIDNHLEKMMMIIRKLKIGYF